MGKNKELRARIQGEIRVINLHLDWIKAELAKPNPDYQDIRKWEKDIARHQRILAKLTGKLPGRRKP